MARPSRVMIKLPVSSFPLDPTCTLPARLSCCANVVVQGLIRLCSYRIAVWTRQAADLATADTDAVKAKILAIGKYLKADCLGYDEKNKLVPGSYGSEVTFESHTVSLSPYLRAGTPRMAGLIPSPQDSEKKGNKNKLVIP